MLRHFISFRGHLHKMHSFCSVLNSVCCNKVFSYYRCFDPQKVILFVVQILLVKMTGTVFMNVLSADSPVLACVGAGQPC